MKTLICLITFTFLLTSCSRSHEVTQIGLMVGSQASGYDSIEVMGRISEGGSIGISGDDYGGEVVLFSDGKEVAKFDSGGHINILSSDLKKISLKGESAVDLYLCVVLHVFEKWPDVYDGVLLEKRKIDAGMINVTLELESRINEGFDILSQGD